MLMHLDLLVLISKTGQRAIKYLSREEFRAVLEKVGNLDRESAFSWLAFLGAALLLVWIFI